MFEQLTSIPCFYFPTKTLLVDDDEVFMETLAYYLSMNIQQCNDSQLALETLSSYEPQINAMFWLKANLETEPGDGIHEKTLAIRLDNVSEILTNSKRYEDFGIVIVDYKMPNMDGLTMLEHLKTKPFKKILLTGKGDDRFGIDVFNKGLIDYYISKDEDDLFPKLKNIIQKMKGEYFIQQAKRLCDHSLQISEISANQNLKKYFSEIISKYNIVEFYLMDFSGTYLLLNKEGKKYYFLVRSASQLNDLASSAKQDAAANDVVEKISNYSQIPFFGEDMNYWEIPGAEWGNYLHPSEALESRSNNLYVSLID